MLTVLLLAVAAATAACAFAVWRVAVSVAESRRSAVVLEQLAMFAPANTPMYIVEKLHREVRTAMQNPGVREKLAGLGVEPVADTPAEFKKFVYKYEPKAATAAVERASGRPMSAGWCGRAGPRRRGRGR